MFGIFRNNSNPFPIFLILSYFTFLPSYLVFVSAALQNSTVDDQDFGLLSYVPPGNWSHDPLLGWETHFYNDSRSYTYMPGAYVTLTFTGAYHMSL